MIWSPKLIYAMTDLHRTLPDHPLFRCTKSNVGSPVNGEVLKSPHSPHIHTAPGILALRRVLMAFARHHAHIGIPSSLMPCLHVLTLMKDIANRSIF